MIFNKSNKSEIYSQSTEKKKKSNIFLKIISTILLKIILFIFFTIFMIILLFYLYRILKRYIKNKLFTYKLTDIFIDKAKERKFNYNFRINDYVVINNNLTSKYKINKIDLEESNINLTTSTDNNNEKMFKINLDTFKITSNNNNIENFKYISKEPYHIPFYMEYIFIKDKKEHLEEFKKDVLDLDNTPGMNYIKYTQNFFSEGNVIENINKIKDHIISTLYFDKDTSNVKLKYKGSKSFKLQSVDKMFRGNLFLFNDIVYKNEYEIIYTKYPKENTPNLINVNDIINKCSQFNFFLIITKSCINIYKFNNYEKIIQLLSIYFPNINSVLNEFMSLFMNNNQIYTAEEKMLNEIKENNSNRIRLLLINYNIIFWIFNNSIDSFIRLLYNYYDGICYISNNNKILYIKLKNKDDKKAFYNKI